MEEIFVLIRLLFTFRKNIQMKQAGLLLFIIVFFLACDIQLFRDDPPAGDELVKIQVDSLIQVQESLVTDFEAALNNLDTASAMNKLVLDYAAHPAIESLDVLPDGIAIRYKSGMIGFLLLEPGEEEEHFTLEEDILVRGDVQVPSAKKSAFFMADYTNIGAEGFNLAGIYETNMPKPGLPVDGYYGQFFSLDRLAHLAGYGVIQFYSHGILYSTNPELSFLTIGEKFDKFNYASILAYNTDFQNKEIGFVTQKINGEMIHRFCVTPGFLVKYNNFTADSTIIFNTSCYSGTGTWADEMEQAGALLYMGYDWRIGSRTSRVWMSDLITKLCDTSRVDAYTVGDWANEQYRSYTSSTKPHPVKGKTDIVWAGNLDAGFWKPEKKEEILRIDVDLYLEDAQFRFTVDGSESFGGGAHRAFVSSREGTSTHVGNTYTTTFNKTLFFTEYTGSMTIQFVGNAVTVDLTQYRKNGGCTSTYTVSKSNVPYVPGQGYYQQGNDVHSGLSTSYQQQCTSTSNTLLNYGVSANDYFKVDVVYR